MFYLFLVFRYCGFSVQLQSVKCTLEVIGMHFIKVDCPVT